MRRPRALTSLCLCLSLCMVCVVPVANADGPEADPAPPERVSLMQALARAESNNVGPAVAALEIEKAEGLLRQARGAELPTLLGNGQYTRLDHDRVTTTGIKIGAANQWNANLALAVPVLVPGTWAGVHRATSARNLARVRSEDVRRDVAAMVARAYLGVLLQRRQLDIARRSRDTAQAHFDFAATRLAGGVGNKLDEVRAEQLLRSEEANQASAQAALVRAQAALGTAVGGDRALDAADDLALPSAVSPAAAIDEARRNRTDVKVLQSQWASAARSHKDVWTLYSPYLAANGTAFVQELGSALQPTHGWQAQLLLTVPFYDGGVRTGVERERAANESQARLQLEAALRGVSIEVQSTFEVMRRTDQVLSSAQAAAALANTAAELANLAYRAGATTNLEVIDAERRAHDAQSQAALAEEASREARLDVLVATGRFP